MLILARKVGEAITIADDITIKVLEVKGGQVKIGVDAPAHITIHRNEVFDKIMEENKRAAKEIPHDLDLLTDVFNTQS
jgi:carbon storage regulator